MKKPLIAAVALAAALSPFAASAQFAKPEDAIKYRQSAYTLLGAHFSRLGAMVQGRVPYDAKTATDNAQLVASLAKLPGHAFPAGSESGLNTRAKPEIWRDNAKFVAAYDKMVAETGKLPAAAGDPGTLKTAFGSAAATCKGCHDEYRRD
ncbi:MAG TPA: cytochrome c [Burkholderiaceae bacterium]|nr:cytochrome c [Burkholderiaceae bacterium]